MAVCTPLTWAPFIPQDQQRLYIDWVYRYCLHWQGEMIEERYTSWFRNSTENYTPQYDNEFERKPTDDIMRLSSPWKDNANVPALVVGALKDMVKDYLCCISFFEDCSAACIGAKDEGNGRRTQG